MIVNFDAQGNLVPYDLIRTNSLDEFEQAFVNAFPLSTTRLSIYIGFLEYIEALGDVLYQVNYKGSWRLWINGSFTTNKLNPNDIDILSLLNDEIVLRQNKNLFEPLFGKNAFLIYHTDAYFLLNNETTQAQELLTYWTNQFGTDRNGSRKGIVELVMTLD